MPLRTESAARFAGQVDSHGLSNTVYNYHHLAGLLLALVSSPDDIAPAEWLPLIWSGDGEPDSASLALLFEDLKPLWNHWLEATEDPQQALRLPADCKVVDGEPSAALTGFSEGLVQGYSWLQEEWESFFALVAESEDFAEMENFFSTTLTCAMLLAEPQAVRQAMAADGDEPMTLEEALTMLPEGLTLFAALGQSVARATN